MSTTTTTTTTTHDPLAGHPNSHHLRRTGGPATYRARGGVKTHGTHGAAPTPSIPRARTAGR